MAFLFAPARRSLHAGLTSSLLVLATGSFFAQQPQPLDPLTADERSTAERVARADPKVRELLGAGGRANHIEFIALKSDTETAEPRRHAEVNLLRDDARYGVRVVVELGAKPIVVAVQRMDESNIPMTEIELQSAAKLASENATVRTILGDQLAKVQVEGLRVFTINKADPCFAQRCVRLLYRIDRDYISDPIVTVNLSKQTLLVERRKR
jgi:hypothetical protein